MKYIAFVFLLFLLNSCLNNSPINKRATTTIAIPMAIEPKKYDWGILPYDIQIPTKVFSITNLGVDAIKNCSAAKISGENPSAFFILEDNCQTLPLEVARSCTIIVAPKALAADQSYKATLIRDCAVGGVISTTENALTVTGKIHSSPQLLSANNFTTILEDQSMLISYSSLLSQLNYNDPGNDKKVSIIINSLATGTLTKNGVSLINSNFPVKIDYLDMLLWTPPENISGGMVVLNVSLYDQFNYSVANKDIAVTITSVEDAPKLEKNLPLFINEGDSSQVITYSDHLKVSDVESTDTNISFTVTTPPSYGTLSLTTFTQNDLKNGLLTYSHSGGEVHRDSFIFSYTDGVTTISGVSFTIIVAPINDQPILTNIGSTVIEASSSNIITSTMLNLTDAETSSSSLKFTLITIPVTGTLKKGSTTLAINDTFSVSDISSNLIKYNHSGETTSVTFTFTYTDGEYTSSVQTFTITVTPTNDNPSVSKNKAITVLEGSANNIISDAFLKVVDVDNTNSDLTFTIITGPVNGTLSGVLSLPASFTQEDVANSLVKYTHNGSETTTDSFTFQYQDLASGALGTPETFSIIITPVNDAPSVGANQSVSASVATATTITFNAGSDPEGSTLIYTVVTQPTHGTLSSCSTNTCVYTPNANYYGSDSFTYKVNDSYLDSATNASVTINVSLLAPVQTITATTSSNPGYLLFSNTNTSLFVDTLIGDTLETYVYAPTTGTATIPGTSTDLTVDNLTGPKRMSLSSDGVSLYLASNVGNKVGVYYLNPTTQALTYFQNLALTTAIDVQASFDSMYVYAISNTTDVIKKYTRDYTTGTGDLTYDVDYTDPDDPVQIALHPSGSFAYVASTNASRIYYYTRNIATGVLSYVGFVNGTGITDINSMIISHDGKNLYTASGGAEDKVGVYSIDLTTGLPSYVESHTNSVGDFDMLAQSKDGKFISASSFSNGKIVFYARNSQTGLLTHVETVTANAYDMQFSHDGQFFAYSTYTDDTIKLNSFKANAKTNNLTFVENITSNVTSAKSMLIDPLGRYLYVSLSDNVTGNIAIFSRNYATGALTYISTTSTTSINIDSMTMSPDGRFLYITDGLDGEITQFTRNIDTGALSAETQLLTSSSSYIKKMLIPHDQRHLYLTGGMENTGDIGFIKVYSRNIDTGALTLSYTYDDTTTSTTLGVPNPNGMVISSDGIYLYATSKSKDSIIYYTRNKTTGALSSRTSVTTSSTVTGLDGPVDLVMSKNGKYIYVASYNNNNIVVFSRNPSTGVITYETYYTNNTMSNLTRLFGFEGPKKIILTPDQLGLYVLGNNSIAYFSVNSSTGMLSFVGYKMYGLSTNEGYLNGLWDIEISPDSGYIYGAANTSNAVSGWERN